MSGDALVVTTPETSGKVKRLRNSPRVEMRPYRMGRVKDGIEPVTDLAEVLMDKGSRECLTGLIRRKYGREYKLVTGIERLLRKPDRSNHVILRITRA